MFPPLWAPSVGPGAGISPGASQEAIAQAFRATILRCHPDLHGNAPWAIAKTQRVLRAAEELRAERGGAATGWARAGGRVGDTNGPFLRRGPNVSFYPNSAFDYWSAYGERAPTPEEAARFAQDWEAAKEVAQERLRRQQAQRNGQLIADEAGMKAMPFAAAAAAVLLLFGQARTAPDCCFLIRSKVLTRPPQSLLAGLRLSDAVVDTDCIPAEACADAFHRRLLSAISDRCSSLESLTQTWGSPRAQRPLVTATPAAVGSAASCEEASGPRASCTQSKCGLGEWLRLDFH